MKVKCIECGKGFETFDDRRKYCSGKCRQRAYRKTPRGAQAMKAYNKRYKRPDITLVCAVCNQPFVTARKNRIACDKPGCLRKSLSIAVKKSMSKRPEHWRMVGNANKRAQRNIDKKPCEICGSGERIHKHHDNYNQPLNVKHLCPLHHKQRHRELLQLRYVT